jgi:type I restriction enzyme S subunit
MYEVKYRDIDEMKSSYIEWIGEIPIDWRIRRLKYLASIDTGNKDTQDRDDDGLYPFYVRSDTVERINSYSYEGEAILTAGDGVGVGRVFHYVDGKFAYHQRVYKLSEFKNSCGKYLYYYVSENFHKEVMKLSAKSTVDSLRRPMFSNFPVVLPDFGLQQKIANFLDIKIAQFDQIISKKEQLIEKLEEAKKSLISEVVTGKVKIVDGQLVERDASEMKDNGVEWLGKIPVGWNEKRVKDVFDLRNERNYKAMNDVQLLTLYTTEGIRRAEDVENKTGNTVRTVHEYKKVYRNDIVVNIILAWMGAIGYSDYSGVISPAYDIYSPKNEVESKYYAYLFRLPKFSGECFRYGRGIMLMRWRTYSDEFRSIRICVPSYDEQKEIVKFIDIKVADIIKVINKNKEQIEKLKQAKQSLISEAVTGKIDLRDWEIIEEGEMQ